MHTEPVIGHRAAKQFQTPANHSTRISFHPPHFQNQMQRDAASTAKSCKLGQANQLSTHTNKHIYNAVMPLTFDATLPAPPPTPNAPTTTSWWHRVRFANMSGFAVFCRDFICRFMVFSSGAEFWCCRREAVSGYVDGWLFILDVRFWSTEIKRSGFLKNYVQMLRNCGANKRLFLF